LVFVVRRYEKREAENEKLGGASGAGRLNESAGRPGRFREDVEHTIIDRWRSTSMNAACPECGAEIELGTVEVGEIVSCPDCGVDLEVLNANPVELGLAPEEGEDWGE
jgi:alpha-aminoadipate carrier protein LysW